MVFILWVWKQVDGIRVGAFPCEKSQQGGSTGGRALAAGWHDMAWRDWGLPHFRLIF